MNRGERASARRYARAALDVATARGEQAALQAELKAAAESFAGHAELHAVLTNPALSAEKRRAVVAAVWKQGSDLFRRLLGLLSDRDRLALLPSLAEAYTAAWNAQRGVVLAEVVSAQPLPEATVAPLRAALARVSGGEVELKRREDPALLGGLLVNMGGRTYDGSVRGRLRALRRALVENA